MIGEIYRKILKKNKKGLEYKSSFEIQNAENLLVILREKLLVLVFEELYLYNFCPKIPRKAYQKRKQERTTNRYIIDTVQKPWSESPLVRFTSSFYHWVLCKVLHFLYSLLSLHSKLACSEEWKSSSNFFLMPRHYHLHVQNLVDDWAS